MTEAFKAVGAWQDAYQEDMRLGRGPKQMGSIWSYLSAGEYLDGLPVVEDWGCGHAFARQFFPNSRYIGVDGSGPWCDEVDDLATRTSHPDGILLRHVLEHNEDWPRILTNALRCCRRKIMVCLHIPMKEETTVNKPYRPERGHRGIPVYHLGRTELEQVLGAVSEYQIEPFHRDILVRIEL
jgi:hypothetical protein